MPRIGKFDPDRARVDIRPRRPTDPAPACQARAASSTRLRTVPSRSIRVMRRNLGAGDRRAAPAVPRRSWHGRVVEHTTSSIAAPAPPLAEVRRGVRQAHCSAVRKGRGSQEQAKPSPSGSTPIRSRSGPPLARKSCCALSADAILGAGRIRTSRSRKAAALEHLDARRVCGRQGEFHDIRASVARPLRQVGGLDERHIAPGSARSVRRRFRSSRAPRRGEILFVGNAGVVVHHFARFFLDPGRSTATRTGRGSVGCFTAGHLGRRGRRRNRSAHPGARSIARGGAAARVEKPPWAGRQTVTGPVPGAVAAAPRT